MFLFITFLGGFTLQYNMTEYIKWISGIHKYKNMHPNHCTDCIVKYLTN